MSHEKPAYLSFKSSLIRGFIFLSIKGRSGSAICILVSDQNIRRLLLDKICLKQIFI